MLRRVCSRLGRRYFSSCAHRPVGFIGVGNMGGHMARNLLQGGHQVVVYDKIESSLEPFRAESKASVASDLAELSATCDTIITMLPSSPHVRGVYLDGENALLTAPDAQGKLFIDCSTIDPGTAREVYAGAKDAGAQMVDAPVSGGVTGAEAGTLTFMVGGDVQEFEAAQDFLNHMGANIVHCGSSGNGQVAKVCNNLVLGISMCAVAEGMNLGVKLGMDPSVLAGIFNTSSARCWSSDTYNPCPGVIEGIPSSNDYAGGFAVELMMKDMRLAGMAAESAKSRLDMGEQAMNVYEKAAKRFPGQDFSVVYKDYSEDE